MKRENFEIYDKDIFELNTRVKSLRENNGFLEVVLEKTPFRPSSGGQPSDNGFLENENFKGFVLEVLDKEDLIHKVKVEFGNLKIGDFVNAKINANRRNKLKIMHSGEHLFFGVLKRLLEEQGSFLEAEKINLDEEEGNLFVKTEKLDFDLLFKAEEIANELIEKGINVFVHYATKENLKDFVDKGLRVKVDRIEEDFIRIVEFEGVDVSACTGTHVKNTKEIKLFLISDFKKLGDEKFVIKFKTGGNAKNNLMIQSRVLRLIKDLSGKNENEIFDFFKKQIFDKERFKGKYHAYFSEFLQNVKFEKLNNLEFCFLVLEDEDLKVLIKNASKLCTKNRVVCFLNVVKKDYDFSKEQNNEYDIVCMSSEDLNIDLKKIFEEIIKEFDGKIGGNKNYVLGRIKCSDCEFFKSNFIKFLNEKNF